MRRAGRVVVLVAVVGVVAATVLTVMIGVSGRGREKIDETRAYPIADRHVCDAVRGFGPDVRIVPGLRNAVQDKPLFSFQRRKVTVEVSYDLEPPPGGAGVGEFFADVRLAWEGRGYRIDRYDVVERRAVLAATDPVDGFRLVLHRGPAGNMWITAGSPRVPQTGVYPPPPAGCPQLRSDRG